MVGGDYSGLALIVGASDPPLHISARGQVQLFELLCGMTRAGLYCFQRKKAGIARVGCKGVLGMSSEQKGPSQLNLDVRHAHARERPPLPAGIP